MTSDLQNTQSNEDFHNNLVSISNLYRTFFGPLTDKNINNSSNVVAENKKEGRGEDEADEEESDEEIEEIIGKKVKIYFYF